MAGTPVTGELNNRQILFIEEYVNGPFRGCAAKCVVRAGYAPKGAKSFGSQLCNPKLYPVVAAAIEKAMAERRERLKKPLMEAEETLNWIQRVMEFNPMDFFEPGGKGGAYGLQGWLMSEEQYKNLPREIGQMIEEIERRETVVGKGPMAKTIVKYWVKLVSKTAMAQLAAKCQLGEKINQSTTVKFDWDSLHKKMEEGEKDDIEEAISQAGQDVPRLEAREGADDTQQERSDSEPQAGIEDAEFEPQDKPPVTGRGRGGRNGNGKVK
jgi:hypothetical protein